MTNTARKFKCKTWTDESLKDPNFKEKLINPKGKVCPELKVIKSDTEILIPHKRRSTEYWLSNMIVRENIQFRDFLTISFYKPNKDVIKQYADNKHIKNVILHFFYNTTRPTNPIRIWFFNEREGMFFRQGKNQNLELVQSGDLHIHLSLIHI